jgi:hypothetical protein
MPERTAIAGLQCSSPIDSLAAASNCASNLDARTRPNAALRTPRRIIPCRSRGGFPDSDGPSRIFSWYVIHMTAIARPVRPRGRQSLNGTGDSPQLRVRLPDALRAALTRRAAHEGVTVSELARQILASAATEARPENRVQLELHRALLGKLLGDLGLAREIAYVNLDRMRSSVRGAQAQGWLDEWAELIDDPGPRLIDVFLGEDEHSTDMRQVSPFAGVLTQQERLAAIERARSNASRRPGARDPCSDPDHRGGADHRAR